MTAGVSLVDPVNWLAVTDAEYGVLQCLVDYFTSMWWEIEIFPYLTDRPISSSPVFIVRCVKVVNKENVDDKSKTCSLYLGGCVVL